MVCDEYPPCVSGGIGIVTQGLARSLVAAGHDVTVVGIYQPYIRDVRKAGAENDRGVTVYRLPPSSGLQGKRLKQLSERLRLARWISAHEQSLGFDLIEAPDYTGPAAFYRGRLPVLVRMHGSYTLLDATLKRPPSRMYHFFEKRSMERAAHLAAVSRFCAAETLRLNSVSKPYSVIYNAVDTDFFRPLDDVPVEENQVLYFGTVSSKKGVAFLIEAFPRIADRFPGARLVLMGKDSFTYNGKTLTEYLAQNRFGMIREKVAYIGSVPHGNEFLATVRKAHVCVFPLLGEAFGLAPAEAMACGKPVIFSYYGSGPEIIEQNVSGLLCDPHKPHDLEHAICRVLGDASLASRLGSEARKRAEQRFSYSRWIQENVALYEKILAQ